MKRFIISVLCVAVFFLGLGSLAENAGARFKSDARALEVIKQARVAIGGDEAIKNVRGLTITGRAAKTLKINGIEKSETGDLEINLQMPNQFAKTIKFAHQNGGGETAVEKDVIVVRKMGDKADFNLETPGNGEKRVFRMKKGEKVEILSGDANTTPEKILVDKDIKFNHAGVRQNEFFRTAFALLLSTPEGSEVTYAYDGESSVDGNSCDVVLAQMTGDAVKLFIDKSTHLPLMMSYQGMKPFVIKVDKNEAAEAPVRNFRIIKGEGEAPETAEIQVRFSDYRNVGGVQLPFKWTQTSNGQPDQNIDIANYDINPVNIAEKFNKRANRVMLRTKNPE